MRDGRTASDVGGAVAARGSVVEIDAWRAEKDVLPVSVEPFNAEAHLDALGAAITPTERFFVRNHFAMPELDAATYRLNVDGAVERPTSLSLDDLAPMHHHAVTMTMECAGNGRTLVKPLPPGTRWGLGAVSTGTFVGVQLREVLGIIGLRKDVMEILCVGADRGAPAPGRAVEAYARSLPLAVAMHPDTILATAMNGEPLTREHGSPLRIVVPSWYGVASVKWLTQLTALTQPFEGFFQREHYVYKEEAGTAENSPVRTKRVRALIASPGDGARLRAGRVEIRGTAWSGSASIRKVEISTDGGRQWSIASLERSASLHAASVWRMTWEATAGEHEIIARAMDDAGNIQPLDGVWNALGYGNNGVQRVRVSVR